ncbi:poly(A) RNA polymerase, mitochondrial [Phymastichus coffea]|uniref:poly(A) RNA polymerase, mitochondrial n=1 Tax=Phymastichus coffea TaxID=108790 RepID=UPI00273C6E1B|nr:poly(A) RNA polymerase, mitochondrial [Phymastichus coffea]
MSLLMRATADILFNSNKSYFKLTSNIVFKLYTNNFSKILSSNVNICTIRLHETEAFNVSQKKIVNITYDELFERRRLQAQHSVLIEVQSEKSYTDVYLCCSQYGKIKSVFHYAIHKTNRHFVLIEFENQNSINAILAASTHVNCNQIIPVQTTMLWFRNYKQKLDKKLSNSLADFHLYKNFTKILNENEVLKSLTMAESISHQMFLLYRVTKLNDIGIRLRFYTAHLLERCFYGLFPNIAVLPFGSSVNGFGKDGCDLDLSIILAKNKAETSASQLVFQTKSNYSHEKYETRKIIEIIADTIKVFLPGISNMRKVLEARVPIIKFHHTLTGIECDLSMTNMSAYYMSELLYIYGEIDNRVKPLIFTVRKWAESVQLTNKMVPGQCITNFSLSLMVIFFLQQKKILPTINLLKAHATRDDIRIADVCVDCTFHRDITKLQEVTKGHSQDSLEELLREFFTFYGNFDFETKAISLKEGHTLAKPEYSALYICNPLELTFNVSKNVSFQELGRMRAAIRCAAWYLEDANSNKKSENWGLISLFLNKSIEKTYIAPSIDIEALFQSNKDFTIKKDSNVKSTQKKNKSKFS